MSDAAAPFTLRLLPLPAKLVITCFLLAVGLGYSSAMVQLHMQDSRSGEAMPTPDDVVLKFTGKKYLKESPPAPVSKLEKLIMGPIAGAPWNGTGSMAPAFFDKDREYKSLTDGAAPDVKVKVDAEREGERLALQLWINAQPDERKAAYESDRFVPPADKAPKAIAAKFLHDPAKPESGLKVKSILETRCVYCHAKDGREPIYPLETYSELEKYLDVPAAVQVPPGGGWVRVEVPIDIVKLTQSTHAHLLSFAVLFSLTGLVFAFTGFPTVVRCVFGPLALIAVVCDVCLWWFARMSDPYGPYFAYCIIGTGGLVGLGLSVQIVLSVFSMYGRGGRLVLAGLFAAGLGIASLVYVTEIHPGLKAKSERLKAATDSSKPADKTSGEPTPPAKDKTPPKTNGTTPPPPGAPSVMEKLLTGPFKKGAKLNKREGGMVAAFFDQDDAFAKALAANSPDLPRLQAEREGEQAILMAWVKAAPDVRKKAYDDDAFPLPPDLASKPLTATFKAGDKAKVKSVLAARCVTCHKDEDGAEQADKPLQTYDQIAKYLEGKSAPATNTTATPPTTPDPKKTPDPVVVTPPKKDPPTPMGPSLLDKLLTGAFKKGGKWSGTAEGGMVRAFFDKDDVYKDALKEGGPDLPKLTAERESEQAVVLAWIRSAPDARKQAYETNTFPLPTSLAGKPLTAEFKNGDKAVKVKSLFEARCAICHAAGRDKEDAPLSTYDEILGYLTPTAVDPKLDPKVDPKTEVKPQPTPPPPMPPAPKPEPPKLVAPIPTAKE